ncbi:MAG: methyltransferase [Lachnospiraceae bacterium]|nr:methyltransferase [Lachnospiraceae bacterium]
MSGNEKKEFGDYQTPIDFCYKVCEYIQRQGFAVEAKAILEPTCGVGNFLSAACSIFRCSNVFGIEINEKYAQLSREAVPSAKVVIDNIFDVNTKQICGTSDVLVIGNPPWATNADLFYNLPQKNNFKRLRGIDALTGSSNFDISEYIILQLLGEYKNTNSTICMLCKTSVARNVILEIARSQIRYDKIEMLNFSSNRIFGVSAAACIFIVRLSPEGGNTSVVCDVKNFDDDSLLDTLIVKDGTLKTLNTQVDLEGTCQLAWRSGVKHDCSKVMELNLKNGKLINKQKTIVDIERDLVFPLVKSSTFKKPVLTDFTQFVIITQTKPKQDTTYIQYSCPRTWEYLNDNMDYFSRRKSIIYKNAAPFSMFGIGDYSFFPYKVGLSGFYKKPLFCLLHSTKPVMTDDTAYFLAFKDYNVAYTMMLLLNSKTVQGFLLSIAFLDSKRPYTVKLLSRLDLKKCIAAVSFNEITNTEAELQLPRYVTAGMYAQLKNYI